MTKIPVLHRANVTMPTATDKRLNGLPARIVSVGTAVPPCSYSQEDILELFDITEERIRSVFLNCFIGRRHLTLPPIGGDGKPKMESQGELLHKHVTTSVDMGSRAIQECLDRLGAERKDISYLCCVSSTGFVTPGLSALLIKELDLPRDCSRLDVVGMGCNAGLNGLTAVAGWASSHPNQLAIMACIESCSSAYVFDGTMKTSVVNSLFGDGAGAVAVVSGDKYAARGIQLIGFSSHIIIEAIQAMRYDWDESQGKFSFFLDRDTPYVVGAHAERAIDTLLRGTGISRSDIAHWIVHSGGKRVIDAIQVNLGLSRYDVRHTSGVLHDYGNLSSGSFLFSYDRLMRENAVLPGEMGILMTMGPGSTIETALFSANPE